MEEHNCGDFSYDITCLPVFENVLEETLRKTSVLKRKDWSTFMYSITHSISEQKVGLVSTTDAYDTICRVITEKYPRFRGFESILRAKLRNAFKNDRYVKKKCNPIQADFECQLHEKNSKECATTGKIKNRRYSNEDILFESFSQDTSAACRIDHLNSILKKCKRPEPKSTRIGHALCDKLQILYKDAKVDKELDKSILEHFSEGFDHRTLIIWNQPIIFLTFLYPCLQNPEVLEMEAKLFYGESEYKKMQENVNALIDVINHQHFHLDFPYSVLQFFISINRNTEIFKVFTISNETIVPVP
ncbi:unnamed protein product, partial [Allacma fusca]